MTGSTPALEPKIYLTGFMGSGKSTIGPILAGFLGCEFIDLDSHIESEAGLTIPDIFQKSGEAAFRKLESATLQREATGKRKVIALGGGAILDPGNLALIRRTGVLIYLQVPVPELFQRLKADDDRPLLKVDETGDKQRDEILYGRIADLLGSREPIYLEADHVLAAFGRGPEECAGDILNLLGESRG
ncbi:shikimate kinase [candidate division KSB1 bacterium]